MNLLPAHNYHANSQVCEIQQTEHFREANIGDLYCIDSSETKYY